MDIPILIDHDLTRQIGHVDEHGIATMDDGHMLTVEEMFNVTGGAGIEYTVFKTINEVHFVKEFKIMEFSSLTTPRNKPADFSGLVNEKLLDLYLEYLKGEIKAGRISIED